MKWKLILLILPLALVVCFFDPMLFPLIEEWLRPHSQQEVVQKIFTSQQIYDVVMTSPQVTAQWLTQKQEEEIDTSKFGDYNMSQPVVLSPEQVQEIKKLFQKPSSYYWGNWVSGCIPRYGVVFNFRSNGHTVRIGLCFQCHVLSVFDGEDNNAKAINGQIIIDPMLKPLKTLCKTLFPDDPRIQALK